MRSVGMAGEEPVLSAYHKGSNGIFRGIVVWCDMAVFHIPDKLVSGRGSGHDRYLITLEY